MDAERSVIADMRTFLLWSSFTSWFIDRGRVEHMFSAGGRWELIGCAVGGADGDRVMGTGMWLVLCGVCVCGVWCVLFVCVWCVCVVCVVCVFVVCVVCVCVFVCGVLSGLLNFISKFYGWSPLQDHKPAYFYRWEFLKFVSIALHSDFIILSIANIGTSAFIRNFYLPQYDEWGQSYHLHTNTNNAQGVLNLTVTRLLFFFLTMSAFLLWIIKHAMAIHVTGHVASTRYYIFNTNS